MATMNHNANHTVRVWDLPTRVFHWALLMFVVFLVITGLRGGDAMVWHFRFGYCVLSLLLFRLVWGLIGGRWSRFASFIYAPGTIVNYLKGAGKPEHSVGHNPLGAGSVFAMLFFLLAQVGTGLFADDDISNSGPLSKFVSNARVGALTAYHKNYGKYILLLLVVLHIGAVLFYLKKKKENLITPMIKGDKQLAYPVESARDTAGSRCVALTVFAVCAGVVAAMVKWAG
jgi:cytochrome b